MAWPPELQEQARELRASGMLVKQIVDTLGVPQPTVVRWTNDKFADRERKKARTRKRSKRKKCVVCGKRVSNTASMCRPCYKKTQRQWTRERLIEAFQNWALKHGHAPTLGEWVASGGDEHPSVFSILDGPTAPFRSWSELVLAAGFTPRQRRSSKNLSREERRELRRQQREERLKRALGKESGDQGTDDGVSAGAAEGPG
jgi:hypothetical protein